jgi:hypothetical protein
MDRAKMRPVEKLWKRFGREVKRHPKRALLLAVLAAVGAYFWAPILAGWLDADSAPSQGEASTIAVAPANSGADRGSTASAALESDWRALRDAILGDARMRPSEDLLRQRNPFAPTAAQVAALEAARKKQEQEEEQRKRQSARQATRTLKPAFDPRRLPLTLTATVTGGRRRLATINGKVVGEGGVVRVNAAPPTDVDPTPPPDEAERLAPLVTDASGDGEIAAPAVETITLRLVAVRASSVLLEHNGAKFELKLRPRKRLQEKG